MDSINEYGYLLIIHNLDYIQKIIVPAVVLNVRTLLSQNFSKLFQMEITRTRYFQYGYLQAVTFPVDVNWR
jgi:hypothetical protein